jgi:hypothetical protein
MRSKSKLTEPQKKLLIEVSNYMGKKCSIDYEVLKSLCTECRSFDNTFEALYSRGYFKRVPSLVYSHNNNLFVLS